MVGENSKSADALSDFLIVLHIISQNQTTYLFGPDVIFKTVKGLLIITI